MLLVYLRLAISAFYRPYGKLTSASSRTFLKTLLSALNIADMNERKKFIGLCGMVSSS
jgi:hypothetical protein